MLLQELLLLVVEVVGAHSTHDGGNRHHARRRLHRQPHLQGRSSVEDGIDAAEALVGVHRVMVLLHRGRVWGRRLHGGLHVLLVLVRMLLRMLLLVGGHVVLGEMRALRTVRVHRHLQSGGLIVWGHSFHRAGTRSRQTVGVVVSRAHRIRGILGSKATHAHVITGSRGASGGKRKVPVDVVGREVLQTIHLALLVLILGVLHHQAALAALQLATIQAQCCIFI